MSFTLLQRCSAPSHHTRAYSLTPLVFLLGLIVAQARDARTTKTATNSTPPQPMVGLDSKSSREKSSESPPRAAAADRTSRVEALYAQYCQRCHGTDGQGAKARKVARSELPDFTRRAWHESRSSSQLEISILDGKGTAMPPFAGKLTRGQIQDLVAYLRTFGPCAKKLDKEPPSDFAKRFRELQEELKSLQEPVSKTAPSPR